MADGVTIDLAGTILSCLIIEDDSERTRWLYNHIELQQPAMNLGTIFSDMNLQFDLGNN